MLKALCAVEMVEYSKTEYTRKEKFSLLLLLLIVAYYVWKVFFLEFPSEKIKIVVVEENVLCTNHGSCTQLVYFRNDRRKLVNFSTNRRPWVRKGDQVELMRQRQKTYGRNASIKYRYWFPDAHNK